VLTDAPSFTATSPAIRKALASNPRLPQLLTSIDALRGADREDELQRALGVSSTTGAHRSANIRYEEGDMAALRAFAEAVEAAIRGEKQDTLGLDWGDET
jgi:zinc finger HIT domain-containing protein 3